MQENSLHLNLCLRKRREVHSYLSLSVSYNIDPKTIVAMMWHSAFTTTACMLAVVAAGGATAVATFPGEAGNVARVAGDTITNAGVRLKWFYHQHGVIKKTSKGIVKGCQWVSK